LLHDCARNTLNAVKAYILHKFLSYTNVAVVTPSRVTANIANVALVMARHVCSTVCFGELAMTWVI